MQQQETDLALITAVLNGDTAVYAELVKRHQRFVFTLALRFTKTGKMPKRWPRIALLKLNLL
ncbi:RNA polymerase sigma factor [Pedobacter hartonius]|uniref:hypothetical protein n=1 Tax=Pedobacter hartonius TaxID=425514 RepID=UPI001FE15D35|nr:hypothetical protein [Pedobacter hartonius]